jgi:drug/metabolite transporter (DMT)-like permease
MRAYALGLLALNLLTLIWGTTFVVVKGAVAEISPSLLVLLRFLVAGLFFLPFLFRLPPGPWAPAWSWPSGSF